MDYELLEQAYVKSILTWPTYSLGRHVISSYVTLSNAVYLLQNMFNFLLLSVMCPRNCSFQPVL